ncbi:MAG: bifunctional (p)ppGpp synthetase/guanosine-3',5'-bis(diphosphate) 3'-pyrophosphohydrolase [Bacteroidales bacterium]|nr:bifunctional (p)ppGpp synthetase/guanosine-3',5'-bis(diphosphate) 3'-pyrophosphohydrolase [Bacteroidales bacterium]
MTSDKQTIFSAEEKALLRDVLHDLNRQCKPLFTQTEWNNLRRLMHQGIREGAYDRNSHGVSQLLRSLMAARVVQQNIGLKQASVLTLILYPMTASNLISNETVESEFGADTAHLIDSMNRVVRMTGKHNTFEDENFRKLLISMAQDIRVIICLIADRYVLMKLLNHNPDVAYRQQVTRVCKLLYTPMSHRLGLYTIKQELEDMTLKYEDRATYDDIAHQLQQTKVSREAYIKSFIEPIEKRLRETTNLDFHIKGRTKSISSIHHKLVVQQTTIDKIYDLFAIRIIIDEPDRSKEKADCWQVYSIVTDMYVPNPKRMKDWLSIPKSNGYESLHITVHGQDGRWVEVQIRTKRMDEIAERGLAAHWLYKGIKSQSELDQMMSSIRDILENNNASPDEMMKDLSMSLYNEEIFVFTPRGDVFKLPKGATVLDLAFQIHSKLGESCVGAKVGNKNVKINYKLCSGDQVEILTSPQQQPKRDWLNIVVTSKAKTRIRQGLKEIENREAEAGKELLQRRFKNRKIDIEEGELSKLVLRMGFKTQTQFFHALAIDEINVDDVLKAYDAMQTPTIQGDTDPHSAEEFDLKIAQAAEDRNRQNQKEDVLIIDRDLKGLDYSLAGCCHPIYGDEVVGFVSISGGIRIHRKDCVNVRNLEEQYPYRIVKAKWSGKSGSQYSITLRVIGQDDIGIVSNISSLINKEKDTLLRAINIDAEGGLFRGHLTVLVQDLSSLNSLIKKIKLIHGVKQVERVN